MRKGHEHTRRSPLQWSVCPRKAKHMDFPNKHCPLKTITKSNQAARSPTNLLRKSIFSHTHCSESTSTCLRGLAFSTSHKVPSGPGWPGARWARTCEKCRLRLPSVDERTCVGAVVWNWVLSQVLTLSALFVGKNTLHVNASQDLECSKARAKRKSLEDLHRGGRRSWRHLLLSPSRVPSDDSKPEL